MVGCAGPRGPARHSPHPAGDFVQLALKLELVGGQAVANGVIALDFHARIIGPTVRTPHLNGDRLELRLEFHHWLLSWWRRSSTEASRCLRPALGDLWRSKYIRNRSEERRRGSY